MCRWWVLALPSYTVPLVVMMWCAYVSINLLTTDPLASKNLYTPGETRPDRCLDELLTWPRSHSCSGRGPRVQQTGEGRSH